jgi:hypothetical protein
MREQVFVTKFSSYASRLTFSVLCLKANRDEVLAYERAEIISSDVLTP